jgi:antitoxin (DNA-binding transcriptional repressor) of toxin-antitoxin stability system
MYMLWRLCYTAPMHREITQRELRNESGAIMRALDAGASFIVTRNGVPVAEMTPARRRRSTSKADVLKAFKNAPTIDAKRFFTDVDAILNQDPAPRG